MLQREFFEPSQFTGDALAHFGLAPADARGAVHTKQEVAEFILDLVGWKVGVIQPTDRLLEPAAGHADFLLPAAARLLASLPHAPVEKLQQMLAATEVSLESVQECRARLKEAILARGRSESDARLLTERWIQQADFLTYPFDHPFTHIVGNPPYIRLEALPRSLLQLYRSLWTSLYDRADLYVAFIEKSLELLGPQGRLGFICADRWMRNRYGKVLRGRVSEGFHLEVSVDFTGCPAFTTEVDAYPSVFTIKRGTGSVTRTFCKPEISRESLTALASALTSPTPGPGVGLAFEVVRGDAPWVTVQNDGSAILRRLESNLPTLEEAGCKVGIGVATGADAVFIGTAQDLDVEDERRIPLVGTEDIRTGKVEWTGKWVLNPFEADGRLADLEKYPRFARYLHIHEATLRGRNVAKRNPSAWYRTIDRIHEELTRTKKLLIPDIKGAAHVVLEEGSFYPHHNLYYVLPGNWPIHALARILSSRVAHRFVALYCPPLRGGFLRFQAQYLRRIRLPHWASLSASTQSLLLTSDTNALADEGVRRAFGLTEDEWHELGLNPSN